MTVPSQLSLGTKQKAHEERDGEEEARGGWMVLVTPALSQDLSPETWVEWSTRVQLHSHTIQRGSQT